MTKKRIRDPIHGYIFLYPEEIEVIDTPYMQRLRYIKQNGTTYLTYPSALHSRFEHSLGTMKVAGDIIRTLNSKYGSLWKQEYKDENICNTLEKLARSIALIHDTGHLMFSHAGEKALEEQTEKLPKELQKFQKADFALHEMITAYLMKNTDLLERMKVDPNTAFNIFCSKDVNGLPWKVLSNLIRSQLDADKLDYFLRDGYFTGVEFGKIDIQRIISDLEVKKDALNRDVLCLSHRSISAAETLIMERYKLYRWVYLHHKVVLTDELINRVIYYAIEGDLLTFETVEDILFRENNAGGLVYITDDYVIHKVNSAEQNNNSIKMSKKYLKMLLERKLPKPLWKNLVERKEVLQELLGKFSGICANFQKRIELEDKIYDKLKSKFKNNFSREEIVIPYKKFDVYKLAVEAEEEIRISFDDKVEPLSDIRPVVKDIKHRAREEALYAYICLPTSLINNYRKDCINIVLKAVDEI